MGWHKRYGFNSSLGRFCVFEFVNDTILYGAVRNKGRTIEKEATTYRVVEPNYEGSSKGMEADALITFLDWAEQNGILRMIFLLFLFLFFPPSLFSIFQYFNISFYLSPFLSFLFLTLMSMRGGNGQCVGSNEFFVIFVIFFNFLVLIKVVCCDKDSSTHKILREDIRCTHLEVVLDPGHYKKSFQNSLIKLFGKGKQYATFAARLANWFMRSISEAKSMFPTDRQQLTTEFLRRFGFMWPHYTELVCADDCPCRAFHSYAIPKACKSDAPLAKLLGNDSICPLI